MQDHRKLDVWQKSYQFTLGIYRICADLPYEEKYGLSSQIKRAASSIPANIAEGCGRKTNAELERFLYIASGSASELDCHLMLAKDLQMIAAERYRELEAELTLIRKMLHAFIKSLSRK